MWSSAISVPERGKKRVVSTLGLCGKRVARVGRLARARSRLVMRSIESPPFGIRSTTTVPEN